MKGSLIDWSDVQRMAAVMTWLMPSVAMKLFTFNLTTKKPDTNPAIAQAPRAMSIPTTSDVVPFSARVAETTSANDIWAPTARS